MRKKTRQRLFRSLPRRIFLDSSILQTLTTYDKVIYEHDDIPSSSKILQVPDGLRNIEALRDIFFMDQYLRLELILSTNSFLEVEAKFDPLYLQSVRKIRDNWHCTALNDFSFLTRTRVSILNKLEDKQLGYLSIKDMKLIIDAVKFGCDIFLTMERRLPMNSKPIKKLLGISVLRPFELLDMWLPYTDFLFIG